MHALTVGTHIVRNNSIKKNSMCHQKFAPSFRFWKVFFRSFNVHISQKYNSHQFKCTFWWISDQNLSDPPVATITKQIQIQTQIQIQIQILGSQIRTSQILPWQQLNVQWCSVGMAALLNLSATLMVSYSLCPLWYLCHIFSFVFTTVNFHPVCNANGELIIITFVFFLGFTTLVGEDYIYTF